MTAGADGRADLSPGTFTVVEAVQLAVVERSGFIESRHAGSAVVTAADGSVIRSVGVPEGPVLARSCLKPFQVIAMMSAGAPLAGPTAVIASASHTGTDGHVQLVDALLREAGLERDALRCPADWPGDSAARDAARQRGEQKQAVYMNCSGKHAAMLLTCVRNGWSLPDYLSPGHPLQHLIRATIEEFTGEPVAWAATDGCGAPVFALSLTALSRGIGRLGQAGGRPSAPGSLDEHAGVLATAILATPWVIEGPGRPNQIVADRLGLVAKLGAEGVLVMTTPDGVAVAVKVLDGSSRATTAVGLQLLADAGAIDRAEARNVLPELDLAIFGGTEQVGEIRVAIG